MKERHYKGGLIVRADHPKLSGKYEVLLNGNFIGRADTLTQAKQLITARNARSRAK